MAQDEELAGVLITGVYGAGKSSVVEELADRLERQGSPYGALDLDWLMWFDVARDDQHRLARGVFLANLRAVVGNYVAAGVQRFVLAGSVRDRNELELMAAALPFPVRVVRLVVPPEEIERRLRAAPTTGRRDDLRVAREWLAAGTGVGLEDLALANDGSIQDVATAILGWLGWTAPRLSNDR